NHAAGRWKILRWMRPEAAADGEAGAGDDAARGGARVRVECARKCGWHGDHRFMSGVPDSPGRDQEGKKRAMMKGYGTSRHSPFGDHMTFRIPIVLLLTTTLALPAELPVKQVVLYKHGVGFFERSGTLLAGESARLDF